ncbi:MAG: hypothetical protein PHG29_01020, partial [Prolixibacteraceae bacterium]|nr:hypothetical protein [Prolixibacteraceae bacterium]
MQKIHVGFIGAGGIAKSHAYAIQALKFFYDDVPEIVLESVTSAREESRKLFMEKFGFSSANPLKEFVKDKNIE